MAEIKGQYFEEIDLIKCLAIISVVILHSIPYAIKKSIYAQFHIWQAVPVFFVLMGVTSGIYFTKTDIIKNLKNAKIYLKNRFERLIIPFSITWIAALLIGLITDQYYLGVLSLIGKLPTGGLGNYFMSILLQYIFISPLLFIGYKKHPKATLVSLFLVNFIYETIATYITSPIFVNYLYSSLIFRYIFAIGLGLWLHEKLIERKSLSILSRRNAFILLSLPISIIYLYLLRFYKQPFPLFRPEWNTQNLISFFYPATLVGILFKLNIDDLKRIIPYFDKLIVIGKASYHIFLFQMIFFVRRLSFTKFFGSYHNIPIWESFHILGIIGILLNLVICISVGTLFYLANKKLSSIIFE